MMTTVGLLAAALLSTISATTMSIEEAAGDGAPSGIAVVDRGLLSRCSLVLEPILIGEDHLDKFDDAGKFSKILPGDVDRVLPALIKLIRAPDTEHELTLRDSDFDAVDLLHMLNAADYLMLQIVPEGDPLKTLLESIIVGRLRGWLRRPICQHLTSFMEAGDALLPLNLWVEIIELAVASLNVGEIVPPTFGHFIERLPEPALAALFRGVGAAIVGSPSPFSQLPYLLLILDRRPSYWENLVEIATWSVEKIRHCADLDVFIALLRHASCRPTPSESACPDVVLPQDHLDDITTAIVDRILGDLCLDSNRRCCLTSAWLKLLDVMLEPRELGPAVLTKALDWVEAHRSKPNFTLSASCEILLRLVRATPPALFYSGAQPLLERLIFMSLYVTESGASFDLLIICLVELHLRQCSQIPVAVPEGSRPGLMSSLTEKAQW